MPDSPEHLAGRLRDEGGKVRDFFMSLPENSWDDLVYSDGAQWSVRQLLAHIASAEISMGRLVNNIVAGGAGTPEDFDIDAYNDRKVRELDGKLPAELIGQFSDARHANAQTVSRLSQDDLGRTGRHPFLGVTTLSEIIKMIYRHNQIHLRDLRKLSQ
jgi:hypothetical protein